jgi:hypothetical protein
MATRLLTAVMLTRLLAGTAAASTLSVTAAAQIAAPLCVGDCDGDRVVSIDNLLVVVNMALGNQPIINCAVGDVGLDGFVGVADVIAVVNQAMQGCPPIPPTPTPTQVSTTPVAGGLCYESAFCDPCEVYPCRPFGATQEFCCQLAHGQGVTFSWCPPGMYDPTTGGCLQCAHPCAGLPTETPSATATPITTPPIGQPPRGTQ